MCYDSSYEEAASVDAYTEAVEVAGFEADVSGEFEAAECVLAGVVLYGMGELAG